MQNGVLYKVLGQENKLINFKNPEYYVITLNMKEDAICFKSAETICFRCAMAQIT